MVSWFEHPITRPFTLRYFSAVVLSFIFLWVTLVTLLSVATAGYEPHQFNSERFDVSARLWYEKLPNSFLRSSWKCDDSVIKISEGNAVSRTRLIVGVTSSGVYNYLLEGFWDNASEGPIDGLLYRDYTLRNCSVVSMQLDQSTNPSMNYFVLPF